MINTDAKSAPVICSVRRSDRDTPLPLKWRGFLRLPASHLPRVQGTTQNPHVVRDTIRCAARGAYLPRLPVLLHRQDIHRPNAVPVSAETTLPAGVDPAAIHRPGCALVFSPQSPARGGRDNGERPRAGPGYACVLAYSAGAAVVVTVSAAAAVAAPASSAGCA